MEEVVDLFCDIESDDCEAPDIQKNENYYIAEILKLIKSCDEFPLYIYVMIKTLIQKKDLLNENQKKELGELLGIKPKIQIKEKIVTKIVYKERKARAYDGDDY